MSKKPQKRLGKVSKAGLLESEKVWYINFLRSHIREVEQYQSQWCRRYKKCYLCRKPGRENYIFCDKHCDMLTNLLHEQLGE